MENLKFTQNKKKKFFFLIGAIHQFNFWFSLNHKKFPRGDIFFLCENHNEAVIE